jgi:hypothetical protein
MKTAHPCDRCACGGLDRTARAPGLGPDRQQQFADLRRRFDWLVTPQVVPVNPAASVRGPCHLLRSGKTAVLEGIHVQFKRRLFLGLSRLSGRIRSSKRTFLVARHTPATQ